MAIDEQKLKDTIARIEHVRTLDNDTDKINSLIGGLRDLYVAVEEINDLQTKLVEQVTILSKSATTGFNQFVEGFNKINDRLNALERRR